MFDLAYLHQRLNAGEILYNGWLHLPGGVSAEVMGRAGYDTLTIDLQHGLIGDGGLIATLQAIGTTAAAPFVRVPGLHAPDIMRPLDAGAAGIICPMIDTPQQTRELVAACQYAPSGKRSFGPTRAKLLYGDAYPGSSQTPPLIFAMIETRTALDNLDAILDTPNLSGVYVGPGDLSLSLSGRATLDFRTGAAAQAVADIARRTVERGLIPGIFSQGGELARHAVSLGYRFVTAGSDLALLSGAAQSVLAELRGERMSPLTTPTY
ncbi:HpcH/HpaI aldolase family protein [Deinococcus sp.]|uniref:HpcH/HpaI aldolase family protein n=1 Tax=Deinococcus sp. TaxID=47478 RepID=UPI003B5BBE7F